MSRYAGGALGVDITDFLGSGPDFDGIGAQSLKEAAQNFGTIEKLGAEMVGAGQYANARVQAAIAKGKAGVAAAQNSIGAGFAQQLPGIVGAIDFDNMFGGSSGADLYGFDPVGSQGNPFGGTGGRMPLNG